MTRTPINRRDFLRGTALGAAALASSGFIPRTPGKPAVKRQAPYLRNPKLSEKVIVLGFDGMDPGLVRRFIAEGGMPTFARCMERMHFGELQSTNPPQSPVAWSSFITGTDPGGHGIFDFVHRDPSTFTPYMSTSRSYDAESKLTLGSWNIPLESGRVDLMRRGPAFWSVLEEQGIDTTVFQIPANFPVVTEDIKAVSGMGTPDLLGTYGTFTLYSDKPVEGSEKWAGGRFVQVQIIDHAIKTRLTGPANHLRTDGRELEVPLIVHRDPWEPVVKITIDGHELILKQGEWSEWIPLHFPIVPMFQSAAGMVRLYVQQVHPHFRLYVSPINIDPMEPVLPICSPGDYSRELSQAVGRFYTQGFPADSKVLSTGVFSDDEYLVQAKYVLDENLKAFEWQFDRFNEGVFFFYFSVTDQNQHMLWRRMDPSHPFYDPSASPEVKNGIRYFYEKMDEVLKKTLSKVDDRTTLIVLSDHGFAPFTREFHLSTWLIENGYTVLTDKRKQEEAQVYQYVDWSKTKAYALGINGLYINRAGREPHGSVGPEEAKVVKRKLMAELPAVRDPMNGKPIVTAVYDSEEIYSPVFRDLAPDLLMGYHRGYRISDEAVLGKFPRGIVGDRTDAWAGDHCLDPAVVPGLLLTNKRCDSAQPAIWDLAPSILKAFGLEAPKAMTGKAILST